MVFTEDRMWRPAIVFCFILLYMYNHFPPSTCSEITIFMLTCHIRLGYIIFFLIMSMGNSPQSEAPVYTCLLGVTLLLEQFEYANSENSRSAWPASDYGQTLVIITKICLFKYIENFTTKEENFSEKKFWYFSYFCSKHRLWVLVRTASARRF